MELVEAISCFASFCLLFVYLFRLRLPSYTPYPILAVDSFFLNFLYLCTCPTSFLFGVVTGVLCVH